MRNNLFNSSQESLLCLLTQALYQANQADNDPQLPTVLANQPGVFGHIYNAIIETCEAIHPDLVTLRTRYNESWHNNINYGGDISFYLDFSYAVEKGLHSFACKEEACEEDLELASERYYDRNQLD